MLQIWLSIGVVGSGHEILLGVRAFWLLCQTRLNLHLSLHHLHGLAGSGALTLYEDIRMWLSI